MAGTITVVPVARLIGSSGIGIILNWKGLKMEEIEIPERDILCRNCTFLKVQPLICVCTNPANIDNMPNPYHDSCGDFNPNERIKNETRTN